MSEVYSVDVEVTAPVHDTEVSDRVADAVRELFPGAEVESRHGEVVGTAHSLDHLADRIREQEILDTARGQFFEGRRGDTFTFALNKQAAFEGVVNFAVGEDSELGDLHVSVRVTEPSVEAFIDRVAPPTDGGVPLDPEDG